VRVGAVDRPRADVAGEAAARAGGAAEPATGGPAACGQSWRLEDVTSEGTRVLVVCATDVRRDPIQPATMARALDPALDVAHRRVCSCAARVPAPATVDLVVTSVPAAGHARVEPSEVDEADDAVDPGVARRFLACVGAFDANFPPYAVDGCSGEARTTYVYSLSVELSGGAQP
jgi:hypothetical protein